MRGKDFHSTVPFLRCLPALTALLFQVPAVKECFNVSDTGTSGISRSYADALIADDPELQKSIRGLEAMLRVRDSLGSGQGPPLVPVTKVSASPPVGSGAVETDAVPAMLECAAGAVENDAVPALSERAAGLVETDAVPALLECVAVRAQKRCIDPGTGDVRRAIEFWKDAWCCWRSSSDCR